MTLSSALQIGRTGLLANQRALEVTGNNLANIATRGYHRQEVVLSPGVTQRVGPGTHIGTGVQVDAIVRSVNEALEGRLRSAIADEQASVARQEVLEQIEALQNELTDIDLSTHLNDFFNAWSDLANQPLDTSARSLLVQEAQTLAGFMQDLRAGLVDLRLEVDRQVDQAAKAADDIVTRIEQVNSEIARAEIGANESAHSLRDERDRLLAELAEYLEVSTVEHATGEVDVFVGSIPIVLNGDSRGIELRTRTVNNELEIEVVLKDDGSPLDTSTGKLGALVAARKGDIDTALNELDAFAANLIYQTNRVHSQSQGVDGYRSLTSDNSVADSTVALNDPLAELDFLPEHGSFQLHVTQVSSGQRSTTAIDIDLDGIGADTSLDDLATAISGVANVTATVTVDGRLRIDSAGNDFEVTFSDDSSGVLAALGLNTFFNGKDAQSVAVNSDVVSDLNKIAAGRGHVEGDNRGAVAVAALRDQKLTSLGNKSLTESWTAHVSEYGIRLGQTVSRVESSMIVRQNLEAQQQSFSGVNADEEAINLLTYQRAYQGSARFLTVVDEMLQTLLSLL